jgi:hypothetical protein
VKSLRILFAFALLLSASPAFSLQADLNKDGVVDFDDFFLFTDQFGQMGEPESADTVVVLRIDTLYVDPADTVTRSGMPITFADPARNLPCAPWSVSLRATCSVVTLTASPTSI